jgi:hypothetical protein
VAIATLWHNKHVSATTEDAVLGTEYTQVLLHSEIRWLSKGNVLARLF